MLAVLASLSSTSLSLLRASVAFYSACSNALLVVIACHSIKFNPKTFSLRLASATCLRAFSLSASS